LEVYIGDLQGDRITVGEFVAQVTTLHQANSRDSESGLRRSGVRGGFVMPSRRTIMVSSGVAVGALAVGAVGVDANSNGPISNFLRSIIWGDLVREVNVGVKSAGQIFANIRSTQLYLADSRGKIRLNGGVRRVPEFVALSDEDALALARSGSSDSRRGGETHSRSFWEAASLSRIERGQVGAALNFMEQAVREEADKLPSIRYGREDNINLMGDLLGVRVYAFEGPRRAELFARMEKWAGDENWRARWVDRSKPVVWHHPTERVEMAQRAVLIA
jgi:hypothetical protein